jgi:hypothetical protein
MIYAILTVWLVFGLFIAYCLFYFSNPTDRWIIVAIWPFLLAWGILCLIGIGISTVYKIVARDLAKDEP